MNKFQSLVLAFVAVVAIVTCIGLGTRHPGFARGFREGVEIGGRLCIVAAVGAYVALQARTATQ